MFFKKHWTLTFYMKSGNVIVLDNVKEYNITHESGKVTKYTATFWKPMGTYVINLDEVEAVIAKRS